MTSRRRRIHLAFVTSLAAFAALLLSLGACKKEAPAPAATDSPPTAPTAAPTAPTAPAAPSIAPGALAAFAPLPATLDNPQNPASAEKIALGRLLFFDPRLSKNHDVSCNTCHDLARYGVDGLPTSKGHRGQTGTRNSPTVYNAAGHVAQFWDGRAADLEAQAKGPVLNPVEMAAPSEQHIVNVLLAIPAYVDAFAKVWPGDAKPVTYQHMAEAIAAFERTLLTPSRWDRYLAGDESALADAEKRGLTVFLQTGCTACHAGPFVGGHMFQKLGVVKPWPSTADLGRFALTQQDADKLFFKVPSLRNVARTAPYFHDGSVADLPTAVRLMAEHQLGRQLPDDDVGAIVAFLGALTGDLPSERIQPLTLPPAGKKLPKPDPS